MKHVSPAMQSDYRRSPKTIKSEWALFILGSIMFIAIMYGLRIIQDQQELIIGYEETTRARAEILFCVSSEDTLTAK